MVSFDRRAIVWFCLSCLVFTDLYLGPSGSAQIMFDRAFGLRADSMFCVEISSNAWFLPHCVNYVTFGRHALPGIRCGQFLESSFPDAVSFVLQHDLGFVNIMSLHVVETELEQNGHGVRILNSLGD